MKTKANPSAYDKFLFGCGIGVLGLMGANAAFDYKLRPLAIATTVSNAAFDALEIGPIWYKQISEINKVRSGKYKIKEGGEVEYWRSKVKIFTISILSLTLNSISLSKLFIDHSIDDLSIAGGSIVGFQRVFKLFYSSFVPKLEDDLLIKGEDDEKEIKKHKAKPSSFDDKCINVYNGAIFALGITCAALAIATTFVASPIIKTVLSGMIGFYNLNVIIKMAIVPTIKEFQGLWNGEYKVNNMLGYVAQKIMDGLTLLLGVAGLGLSIAMPIMGAPTEMVISNAVLTTATKMMMATRNWCKPPSTSSIFIKMSGEGTSNILQRYEDDFVPSRFLDKVVKERETVGVHQKAM